METISSHDGDTGGDYSRERRKVERDEGVLNVTLSGITSTQSYNEHDINERLCLCREFCFIEIKNRCFQHKENIRE